MVQRGSIRFHVPPPLSSFNQVDAAIADPLSPYLVSPDILDVGPVTGVKTAAAGLPVRKSGRTTGLTTGTVLVTGATVMVTYAGLGVARFRNQIVTTRMAGAGDSGSLLLDDANRAVGLLFAGSLLATVFNPIMPVLRAFRARFTPASGAAAEMPGGRSAEADPGLRATVARHEEMLLRLRNVVGVGAGWKQVGGRMTGRPAVVVMVGRKVHPDRLPTGHLVPRQLDGWLTDVVETGEVMALQRAGKARPARPGVSISHFRGPTGTLGAIIYDPQGRPVILSNNHILANATNGRDGRSAPGDPVIQPGQADGGAAPADMIARLRAFVPLYFI